MVKKRAKRRNKDVGGFLDIILRYAILILIAIPNLAIFYFVFTPLTVYPIYFFLGLFFEVSLLAGNIVLIENVIPIELIKACIAGSAYYFLFILNLSIPKIKLKKRIKMVLLAFLTFLIVNILRIFILSLVAVSGSPFFDITHRLFWYLISTIFVVGIWFAEVKIFRIKEIPFYSDMKFLFKKSSLRR